jgi:glycerol-3-phosphate dehydrogenase (NAD(P)+)
MHTSNSINIAVLGAGSWGIALASHCEKIGHNVSLWEFDASAAELLSHTRERTDVLKGIKLSESINITSNLQKAVQSAEIILLVVPSHVARNVIQNLAKVKVNSDLVLVNCTKGLEIDSLCRISQIVEQEMSSTIFNRYTVLSGPSHAEEVSKGIPTAVVAASKDEIVARFVQQSLNGLTFRIYRSLDVVGVELGGSLKNVIAIAAGICDGAGFGDNTKAALQPRGLAEMSRLGLQMGADSMTFAGLSGMGDLIVTCMSRHSRNRFFGEEIGKGRKLDEILKSMTMVAEGVRTSQAVVKLAKEQNVEMPICAQVYTILFENKNPKLALQDLLTREVKPEFWD